MGQDQSPSSLAIAVHVERCIPKGVTTAPTLLRVRRQVRAGDSLGRDFAFPPPDNDGIFAQDARRVAVGNKDRGHGHHGHPGADPTAPRIVAFPAHGEPQGVRSRRSPALGGASVFLLPGSCPTSPRRHERSSPAPGGVLACRPSTDPAVETARPRWSRRSTRTARSAGGSRGIRTPSLNSWLDLRAPYPQHTYALQVRG